MAALVFFMQYLNLRKIAFVPGIGPYLQEIVHYRKPGAMTDSMTRAPIQADFHCPIESLFHGLSFIFASGFPKLDIEYWQNPIDFDRWNK
jgi:hypothetical protein